MKTLKLIGVAGIAAAVLLGASRITSSFKAGASISLDEELVQEANALHAAFDQYRETAPMTFVHEAECDAAATPQGVIIADACFTHPEFPRQGEQVAYHELSHVLMQRGMYPHNLDQYDRLKSTFWDLPRAPGLDQLPWFRIFNESHYNHSQSTHPHDDHYELFASALSVFRYFPDEFARNYDALKENKEAVRQAGLAVLDLLASINPDKPQEMRRILPQYDKLRKVLEEE